MCIICDRLELIKEGSFAPFVHEFESSYLVIGEHQYFKGYCVLHHKECIEDISDINGEKQEIYFRELMTAGKVIKDFFKAKRINYSCLGNVVSHLHFHIFPRYEEELNAKKKKDPWANAEEFKNFELSDQEYLDLATQLRKAF